MKKVIIQFFIAILLILGLWLGLSQIDFVNFFKVEEKATQMEDSLGDFYMKLIINANDEITDKEIVAPIRKIKNRICADNDIDTTKIQIHIIESDDVNAFALPGNHIVINSRLILFCKNAEELSGVLSHEIGHLEKNHIMKKLTKEIGFAALSAMLNSGSGGAETLKILSSTAYDRQMEDQADEIGVEYLQKSKIDPAPLSDFLYRLSMQESDFQKQLTFISTHPGTEERAKKIFDLSQKKKIKYTPVLSDAVWTKLQEDVSQVNE
jgi:predicted Zn-dependent protease